MITYRVSRLLSVALWIGGAVAYSTGRWGVGSFCYTTACTFWILVDRPADEEEWWRCAGACKRGWVTRGPTGPGTTAKRRPAAPPPSCGGKAGACASCRIAADDDE